MASNKRTIHLGLDYTQFTGGITEVNRKMGLLDAEFKLAQEQAKNYGTATDELGLKQEYLTQKIALQNQKVEEAKRAYEAAATSQNASQKEIDNLQKKFLQESTTLEKLNGQLKTNDETIKQTDKDTKSFGDEIRGLANTLGINVSPAVEKLASKFDGVSASVGNAVLGIGAMVGALVSCTMKAAETADELLTLSSTTGITTDELQKMQYAANFVDVSLDTMTGSMNKLTRTMSSARDGSKDSEEAFRKLGIRITDTHGQLRNSNDVFYEVIDSLGKIKNETERDAMAMKIFGKSAQELNPLIEAGSKQLKELGIEAENLGVVMSGDDLEALGELQDSMDRFKATTEGLKNSLAMTLLPILTSLFDAISRIPVPVLKTLVTLATVITTIVLVVKAIKSLTDTAKAITGFFSGFDASALKTTAIIIGIVVALIALAAIITVLAGKSNELNKSMAAIGQSTTSLTNSVTGAQENIKKSYNNASGVAEFAGGQTWVGEAGPELVTLPRGTKIETEKQAASHMETNYFNVTIDAKNVTDFQRVVQMCKNLQQAERRM